MDDGRRGCGPGLPPSWCSSDQERKRNLKEPPSTLPEGIQEMTTADSVFSVVYTLVP